MRGEGTLRGTTAAELQAQKSHTTDNEGTMRGTPADELKAQKSYTRDNEGTIIDDLYVHQH